MGANSEFIKTARPTGFPFMPNSNIQERVTMVCGESIVIYSGDNRRWFSDRSEAERAHRAHVEFVESMKRSLARSATFAIRAATPRAPNKLQRAAAEIRKRLCELVSGGLTYEGAAAKLWPEEYAKASCEDRARLFAKRAYGHYRQAIRRGEFVEEDSKWQE